MTARLITPPAELAVSLLEAKQNLGFRIAATDDDARIRAWIEGITAHAEHYTGRAVINQTWRVTLDRFPDAIQLAMPPLVSVTSLKYLDAEGVEQTLDPQDYLIDAVSEPGYAVPAPGKTWPSTADQINAVKVEYVAGYGTDSTATPAAIRLYILAKLAEQFDPATRTISKESVGASYLDRLLDRYKVWC
jgi:uncharacterized phiE125 gp8 family phage protein